MPKQFAFIGSKLVVYYPIDKIKSISKALVRFLMILWAITWKEELWKSEF